MTRIDCLQKAFWLGFVYFTHTQSSVTRVEGMCCISGSHSIFMLLCLHFLRSFRIYCICSLNTELSAKSLVFFVYQGAPASLAIGNVLYLISRSGIPTGCVTYCTGSETVRLLCSALSQDLWGESFAAWMHACVQWLIQSKRLQWRLRGIDVHAEEPLQCQERLGLDITPRGKRRKCSSFIQ